MIDIIGYMKIDESKKERVKYLQATIRSYQFLKETANLVIGLEKPSSLLWNTVDKEMRQLGFKRWTLVDMSGTFYYGEGYNALINRFAKHDYILNFMEDHFCVLDNPDILLDFLNAMDDHAVQIAKSSFYQIEQNSARNLKCIEDSRTGKVFINDENNFAQYQKHYGLRYYIGVNTIMSKRFAQRFWDRQCGYRPHEYEIINYDRSFRHLCLIPGTELQAAIDDDHGEPGTCLLNRKDNKFIHTIADLNDQAIQPA